MTSVLDAKMVGALRLAAKRATRAPSVYNTQPWRIVVQRDGIELWADRERALPVLDPVGRQLVISCGCALFNARVALAASGYRATVQRFPDATQPDLVARLTVSEQQTAWVPIGDLEASIERRRTNRRRFADEPIPPAVVHKLTLAAAAEGAEVLPISGPEQRAATARLSAQADSLEKADPAYQAELYAWTSDDPRRVDGVWCATVPYVGVGANPHNSLPMREFDTRAMGWLPSDASSGVNESLLLLGTADDGPTAWLRAGEALERVWLELTRLAYAASPLTQVIEVGETNDRLRSELQLAMHPAVLLRAGRAPEVPRSTRRNLSDMISLAY